MAELGEGGVVAVGQAALFDQLPQTFDQIKIGAVGGQEEQFDVQSLRLLAHQFTALVACVVHDEGDGDVRVLFSDRGKKFTHALRIDVARGPMRDDLFAV